MTDENNNNPSTELDTAAAREWGEVQNQASEHSDQIMAQFGVGQPYVRQHVVEQAQFYLAQSAEAMLEVGKRLVLIREHEPHGEFVEIVERSLGIPARTAQKMMQAAVKYLSPKLQSKASTSTHLSKSSNTSTLAHLGKSKLFELMAEDDDELAALADGGTVAGLTLDEIDRMSTRELRQALRQARHESEEDKAALQQVIADKSATIDKIQTQLEKTRLKPVVPDADSEALRKEAAAVAFQAEHHLRVPVLEALEAVAKHGADHGIDVGHWLRGQLDQIGEAYHYLREQLGMVDWVQGESEAEGWAGQDFDPEAGHDSSHH